MVRDDLVEPCRAVGASPVYVLLTSLLFVVGARLGSRSRLLCVVAAAASDALLFRRSCSR